MRRNPSYTASEFYKLKIVTFDHGQPEECLQLMKNFKRAADGTGNTTVAGKTNELRALLCREALLESD